MSTIGTICPKCKNILVISNNMGIATIHKCLWCGYSWTTERVKQVG